MRLMAIYVTSILYAELYRHLLFLFYFFFSRLRIVPICVHATHTRAAKGSLKLIYVIVFISYILV